MKDINKIAQINIVIANRVLRRQYDRHMAEDLLSIEYMFQNNDFNGLDQIYQKYFIPRNKSAQ
jgi:hypothetical protein